MESRPLREHPSGDLGMQVLPVQQSENRSIPRHPLVSAPRSSNGPVPPGALKLSAGSLSASTIRPLLLIQNAAARLVFDVPRYSRVTPLLADLPVMARVKFKTLVLASRRLRDQPQPTSKS